MSTPAENLKVNKTFVQWMEEHSNFRTMCDEGRGNLVSVTRTNYLLTDVKNEKLRERKRRM